MGIIRILEDTDGAKHLRRRLLTGTEPTLRRNVVCTRLHRRHSDNNKRNIRTTFRSSEKSVSETPQSWYATKRRQVVLRNNRSRLPRIHNQQIRNYSATFKGTNHRGYATANNKHWSQAIRRNGHLLSRPLVQTSTLPRPNHGAH